MAPTAGQIYSDHSSAIEEILNKNVGIFMPSGDPFFKSIFDKRAGEGNNKDIGRDMSIIKTFMGTFTGVMDQGAATKDFTLYGDGATSGADLLGNKIRFSNIDNTWPDPTQGPNMTPFQLKVPMRSSFTSIGITLGEMQAEAHPAYIAEVINPKMMGFSRMMSHTLCSYLYLSQNDNYALTTLATGGFSTSNTGGTADDTLTVTPSNLAIDRFEVGLRVNIVDASTTNDPLFVDPTNEDPTFIVTYVDPLKNELQIMHRTGCDLTTLEAPAAAAKTFAAGDYIVFPGSRAGSDSFTGYAGLNSWLKTGSGGNDNKLLGAEADGTQYIDVTEHPEFKSLGRSLSGATLTEHELRKVTRLFNRAKSKYGQTFDTWLMADGVDLKMQEQLIGRETIDRTGRMASLSNQGSSNGDRPGIGLGFSFDGRSYQSYSSQFVESGTCYGLKLANNNWKRYSPPPPKGVQRSDKLSFAPFYFVGSALSGNNSNILPVMQTNSSNITLPTEMVQMPGMVRMQICPEQAAGIKLTNVAETRIWSDN
jgi:hypothetical protein